VAVSSRKWTAFGSETDSVSDECSSTIAGQFLLSISYIPLMVSNSLEEYGRKRVLYRTVSL